MLYRRKGTSLWWVKFEHRGETIRRSTAKRAKTDAAKAARQIQAQIERERGPAGDSPGVTLGDLEEAHLDFLRSKGFGKRRIDTVSNLHRHLQKHLGGEYRDATTLKARELVEYEGKRRADGHAGQTIRRETQALKRALKIAKRNHLIAALPFDFDELEPIASNPKKMSQRSKPRTKTDVNAALSKLSAKAQRAGHHRMLRLIWETALRYEEFCKCNPSWLRRGELEIPPSESYDDEPRRVPITESSAKTVRELHHLFSGANLNRSLHLACGKAGISPPLTPRDLRATRITELARVDLPAAQKLAGHKSVATTAKYINLGADEAVAVARRSLKKHRSRKNA